jgi:hypothetical protein
LESALDGEITDHPGHEKYDRAGVGLLKLPLTFPASD